MIQHPYTKKQISDYVDGEVDFRDAEGLRRHLQACPTCREIESDYRSLGRLIQKGSSPLEKMEEPDWKQMESRILARVRAEAPFAKASIIRAYYPMLAAVAMTLVLVTSLVFWIVRREALSSDLALGSDLPEYFQTGEARDAESLVDSLSPGERRTYLKLLDAELAQVRPGKIL